LGRAIPPLLFVAALAGCHDDDDSAGVIDIIYAVGDVVLAIIQSIGRAF
jgi:hypothetical protein